MDSQKENEKLTSMLKEVCEAFEEETLSFILNKNWLSPDLRIWWRNNRDYNEKQVLKQRLKEAQSYYNHLCSSAVAVELKVEKLKLELKKYDR